MASSLYPDPRTLPVDDVSLWRDGRCADCGTPTYGTDAARGPSTNTTNVEDREMTDYFVWCANVTCPHHAGEYLGDMDCPPSWAVHDRSC